MPRSYPPEVRRQVIELARAGTPVLQLAATFGLSDATIYNWLKQDRVDRGEVPGLSTEQQLDLSSPTSRTCSASSGCGTGSRPSSMPTRRGSSPPPTELLDSLPVAGSARGHTDSGWGTAPIPW